jgi:hypothetical protein
MQSDLENEKTQTGMRLSAPAQGWRRHQQSSSGVKVSGSALDSSYGNTIGPPQNRYAIEFLTWEVLNLEETET